MALTITVKDVTRESGAENPALEVEYAGFKNEETKDVLTGELTLAYDERITPDSPVGEYAGGTTVNGNDAENYEITFVLGNVTITKISVTASVGTARISYLTIQFDKELAGLTKDNFTVTDGTNPVEITEVTASDNNKSYTLKGSFMTSVTYTAAVTLAGTAYDATHTITGGVLSIKPGSPSGGGGGSSVIRYTVTFDSQGGSKTDSVSVAKNGTAAEPEEPTREGYIFDVWYTDQALTEVYDFNTKVTKNMTLYAKWTADKDKPDETPGTTGPSGPAESEKWANSFSDVKEGDWFYDNVRYTVGGGFMLGVSDTEFAPNETITRAMFMTVLYRASGDTADGKGTPFRDVPADTYYAAAAAWASESKIVNGVTETEFAPDMPITREQIAAILQRYAKFKGIRTDTVGDLSQFTDANQISDCAKENVAWAVGVNLLSGKGNGILDPVGHATRAETAALLQRFLEK